MKLTQWLGFMIMVLVVVPGVLAAPSWGTLSDKPINEDAPAGTVVYSNLKNLCTDSLAPTNILTVSVTSSHTHYSLAMTGNDLTISGLEEDYNDIVGETVQLRCSSTDGTTTTTADTSFKLTITPINDAPVAVDDTTATVNEGSSVTIDVAFNDVEVDGDSKIITLYGVVASKGTATVSANKIVYTPNVDVTADTTDTFTYTVSDNNGGTDEGSVTVTIKPVTTPAVSAEQSRYNTYKNDFEDLDDDYVEFRRAYEKYEDRGDDERVDRYKEKLEDIQDDLNDLLDDVQDLQDDIEDRSPVDRSLLSDAQDLEDDVTDLQDKIDRLLKGDSRQSNAFYADDVAPAAPVSQPAQPEPAVVYSTLPPEALAQLNPPPQAIEQDYTPLVLLGAGIIIMIAVLMFLMVLLFRK